MTDTNEYVDPKGEDLEDGGDTAPAPQKSDPDEDGGGDTGAEESVEALKKELEEAKDELKKFQDKDLNFQNLRKGKEKAEEKVSTLEEQLQEGIAAAKQDILKGVLEDHYEETMKSLVGDDEDLRKEVERQYDRLSDDASTKTQMAQKLTDAYRLATKSDEEQDAMNTAVVSSSGAAVGVKSSKKKFSSEEKELARQLAEAGGMTLEDKDFE